MVDSVTVVQTLTDYGAHIDNFNQSSPERAWQSDSPMNEGYCQGICLDWVRRVLQGGRASFGPNPSKQNQQGYNHADSVHRQATRQGNAWAHYYHYRSEASRVLGANYDSSYEAYSTRHNQLNQLVTDSIALYNQNLDGPDTTVVTLGPLGGRLAEVFSDWHGRPGTAQRGTLRSMFENLRQSRDALQAPAAVTQEQRDQKAWEYFANHMDESYEKGRSYSAVNLVHQRPKTDFTGFAQAMASVTNPEMENFVNGRAMVIGVGMRTNTGESGHAVAVHWRDDNEFIFLDPNYGMFRYGALNGNGQDNVRTALTYLFGTVYPDMEDVEVLNKVGYSIFSV